MASSIWVKNKQEGQRGILAVLILSHGGFASSGEGTEEVTFGKSIQMYSALTGHHHQARHNSLNIHTGGEYGGVQDQRKAATQ